MKHGQPDPTIGQAALNRQAERRSGDAAQSVVRGFFVAVVPVRLRPSPRNADSSFARVVRAPPALGSPPRVGGLRRAPTVFLDERTMSMATKPVTEMSNQELGETAGDFFVMYAHDKRELGRSLRALFAPHPRSRVVDDELGDVRADITRTAAVVEVLGKWNANDAEEREEFLLQGSRLMRLLARERELLAEKGSAK